VIEVNQDPFAPPPNGCNATTGEPASPSTTPGRAQGLLTGSDASDPPSRDLGTEFAYDRFDFG
jgi:hypothetical protein